MKKYIAPVCHIVNFETESIIALSNSNSVGFGEASNNRVTVDEDWDDED